MLLKCHLLYEPNLDHLLKRIAAPPPHCKRDVGSIHTTNIVIISEY